MSLSILKTGALAATLVLALAGASAAAPLHGEINYDTKVKQFHSNGSPSVNWVSEGDDVWIIGSVPGWYKVKVPGPDGWVKKSAVDVFYGPGPGPDYGYGGPSACFSGPFGGLCVNP